MKIALAIIAIAVLSFGVYMYLSPQGEGTVDSGLITYTSDAHGLTFSYPNTYYLEEREVGNGERTHYAIVLTEDTEENKAVREGRAPGREGPVAVTVDIYQNNLDRLDAETWIRSTNDSNFKMSPDGELTPYSVSGLPGYIYRWSGLYEAVAVAVSNDRFVYAFTSTYITPQDPIRDVFDTVVESALIK